MVACGYDDPSAQADSAPRTATSIEHYDDSSDSAEIETASQPTGSDTESSDVSNRAAASTVVVHVEPALITVLAEPEEGSAIVSELANPTLMGGPLVFRSVANEVNPDEEWLEVHLPVRPNGSTGWVRRDQVSLSSNPYRIIVNVDAHQLRVFKGDEVWLESPVAIGTGETPTPVGEFYVIELLKPPNPDGPYGTYAFGLSGFSETLTEFAGGDGVIGIHGTNDPSSLGTDVSHGCVRLANEVISELVGVLPLGTPVVIA